MRLEMNFFIGKYDIYGAFRMPWRMDDFKFDMTLIFKNLAVCQKTIDFNGFAYQFKKSGNRAHFYLDLDILNPIFLT